MKTYILKNNLYNYITFPIGTIIKLINDKNFNIEVVEGELKGKKGHISSFNTWLLEDNDENRKNVIEFKKETSKLIEQTDILIKKWNDLETVKF